MHLFKAKWFRWDIAVFVTYLIISHVLLPVFNNGKDFLWFSSWNLFSFYTSKKTMDIYCEDKNIFLFQSIDQLEVRDHIDPMLFYKKLTKYQTGGFPQKDVRKLYKFIPCGQWKTVLLKGSLYEHAIMKKNLKVLEKRNL